MPIIKNEKGKIVVLNCKFDLTGQTAMSLTITRPDGTNFNRTQATGLSVGPIDLTVDGETYLANQHVLYTIQDGDFTMDGDHTRKLEISFGADKRLANIETVFKVEP